LFEKLFVEKLLPAALLEDEGRPRLAVGLFSAGDPIGVKPAGTGGRTEGAAGLRGTLEEALGGVRGGFVPIVVGLRGGVRFMGERLSVERLLWGSPRVWGLPKSREAEES